MSQENVDTAREVFASFDRRDKAAWLAVNDPSHVVVPPKEWPENAPIRGAEACWDFYVENTEAFQNRDFDLSELIDAGGDKVVAHQHGEMRGKSSGANIVWAFWIVMTFSKRQADACRLVLQSSGSLRSSRAIGVGKQTGFLAIPGCTSQRGTTWAQTPRCAAPQCGWVEGSHGWDPLRSIAGWLGYGPKSL